LVKVVVCALALAFGTVIVGNLVTPDVDVDAVAFARERMPDLRLESKWVEANGLRLHIVLAGPPEGVPIVLLHGHLDFWWGWHRQLPELAAAGFRLIVPDLPGFNESAKPRDLDAYRQDAIAADIHALIQALGYESAYFVGYDSGAVVAWNQAMLYPAAVRGVVSLGVGHPDAYRGRAMPLYARIIRLDGLVESGALRWILRCFNWLPLVAGLKASAPPGAHDEAELDLYRSAWSREDSITTMFLWTVAKSPPVDPDIASTPIEAPVLIVALPDDPVMPVEPARRSVKYCRRAEVVEVPHAGHLFHRESPHEASELILRLVRRR
jgi:pimeloyl-ACP methyl ester carboxylesterase